MVDMVQLSATPQNFFARWAPIPLRLIVGFGFMQHGFAKLNKGPENFAAILHALGTPAPHLMAWISILTELFGGLVILLGALVPLVSIPMVVLLLVAIFTVHLRYGFSSIKLVAVTAAGAQFGPPGYECDYSTSPASPPSSSAAPGHFQSIASLKKARPHQNKTFVADDLESSRSRVSEHNNEPSSHHRKPHPGQPRDRPRTLCRSLV
jgi:putative oxidoreductase